MFTNNLCFFAFGFLSAFLTMVLPMLYLENIKKHFASWGESKPVETFFDEEPAAPSEEDIQRDLLKAEIQNADKRSKDALERVTGMATVVEKLMKDVEKLTKEQAGIAAVASLPPAVTEDDMEEVRQHLQRLDGDVTLLRPRVNKLQESFPIEIGVLRRDLDAANVAHRNYREGNTNTNSAILRRLGALEEILPKKQDQDDEKRLKELVDQAAEIKRLATFHTDQALKTYFDKYTDVLVTDVMRRLAAEIQETFDKRYAPLESVVKPKRRARTK